MIKVMWQLYNWEHQTAGPVHDVEIQEEITFSQLVREQVTEVMGRISPQARFRLVESAPSTILPGYLFKIDCKEISSIASALATASPTTVATLAVTSPSDKAKVFKRSATIEATIIQLHNGTRNGYGLQSRSVKCLVQDSRQF
jgi:hypothetical protein